MGQPDTRERIIYTALRLFWEKGYYSTSIADVLQAANVNSGSLYHFFPGKQDLLLAVLETYRTGIEPMLLEPAWRGVDQPIERIFALLAQYRKSIVETDCTYGCPIGSLALEIHEPDPPVRAALVANFEAWIHAIERCLDEAGDALPRGMDRRMVAEFVLTTMEGGVMLARTFKHVDYFDRAIALLRNYFDGLAAAAQSRQPGKRAPSRRARANRMEP